MRVSSVAEQMNKKHQSKPKKIQEGLPFSDFDTWCKSGSKFIRKVIGGYPQTRDRVWALFDSRNVEQGRFSEEDQSGWINT